VHPANLNHSPNSKSPDESAQNHLADICVAGITPFTTIDFPGRLAGVFYLQGCPWRCRYCCNSEFWALPMFLDAASLATEELPRHNPLVPLEKILHFLNARQGHLEGIVFSGGEPTLHERLPVWMRAVKSMGYQIGLHTAGCCPERLCEVLPFCDWVGMDIKAPFDLYEKITLVPGSGEVARQSAKILMDSRVPHEFRTTVHPDLLSEAEILVMVRDLVSMGSKCHVLQVFRPDHCPDKELKSSSLQSLGVSANLRDTLKSILENFQIRGQ